MIVGLTIWHLVSVLLCASYGAGTSATPADCIISLPDPYRYIRPICLADLDPRSCQRIPVPPQSVLDRSCTISDTRSGPSCVASAIAKSEATLEEKLKDLKESLAQDGVIPDDFMTFEAWKSGQLEAERETNEAKSKRSDGDGPPHEAVKKTSPESHRKPDIQDSLANGSLHHRSESPHTEAPSSSLPASLPHSKDSAAPQKTPHLAPHRYNYASPDCSARIHSASPQSQHAASVLHKSRDRYMLTPCSAREHWVIIELCDDIRIEAVEIGMFEFFSGIVKEVRLSIGGADDDDGDEEEKSDWQEVGRFIGRSVRGTQLFTLDHPTSFHRFIRLDFPAHYGNEYYCPVSTIKVYGMNQMEAFKWESRKQKESELARRRLEEVVQRSQQTVTIQGTVLQISSELPEVTSSPFSAGHSPPTSATDMPPQVTAMDHPSPNILLAAETTATQSQIVASPDIMRPPSHTQIPTPDPSPSHDAARASRVSPIMEGSSAMSRFPTNDDKDDTSKQGRKSSVLPSLNPSPILLPTGTLSPSSLDISSKNIRNTPAASGTPRQEGKADTSESIYAYIIRRLNALEGNSTLGMMYMEEQTKATRGILQKLENSLTDWKSQMDTAQRHALQQERSSWEKTLDNLVHRMEQRDALLERETRSLRSHIRQLREEISWERRRNYLHISATIVMAFLLYLRTQVRSPQPRDVTSDIVEQSSSDDELHRSHLTDDSRLLSSPPDSRVGSLREAPTREYARNRLPSYSRIHLRRPSTPVAQKSRYKSPVASLQRPSSDRANAAQFKNFDEVRLSSSLSGASRSGPRRMGRSAHLHTLSNASRLQHRHSQDADLPCLDDRKSDNEFQRDFWVSRVGGDGASATNMDPDENSSRASGSEVDDDMGDVDSYPTGLSP